MNRHFQWKNRAPFVELLQTSSLLFLTQTILTLSKHYCHISLATIHLWSLLKRPCLKKKATDGQAPQRAHSTAQEKQMAFLEHKKKIKDQEWFQGKRALWSLQQITCPCIQPRLPRKDKNCFIYRQALRYRCENYWKYSFTSVGGLTWVLPDHTENHSQKQTLE